MQKFTADPGKLFICDPISCSLKGIYLILKIFLKDFKYFTNKNCYYNDFFYFFQNLFILFYSLKKFIYNFVSLF